MTSPPAVRPYRPEDHDALHGQLLGDPPGAPGQLDRDPLVRRVRLEGRRRLRPLGPVRDGLVEDAQSEDPVEAEEALPAGAVAPRLQVGPLVAGDDLQRVDLPLARAVGRGGPRQVGRVMALHGDAVAWWRVVHADGSPATCHDGTAVHHLHAEGTPMVQGRRVDMSAAERRDPDEAWDVSAGGRRG